MADGQVVFEIVGDKKPIKQSLADVTSDIERESRKWDRPVEESSKRGAESWDKAADNIIAAIDNAGREIADTMKAAGDSAKQPAAQAEKSWKDAIGGIVAAVSAAKIGTFLIGFGQDAIQAASDLAEVQNVVDVTFGSSGAAQIEQWAKRAGNQFGLTETQAKRFTSTLGAMMKSAGMAGPEIVSMSTDLAGLAADMASFYNLDFDEAFQKIRSGISGETEPLKQLGINMSVANLQAYAMTQGITKAFDKMSQAEQTMLRYQYLMQATADAQGDFARTSDGYANSLRRFETNLEQLKTNVGGVILPIVNEAINGINNLMGALTQTKPTTVLDEIAAIDLQTEQKLAQIQQTADEARALTETLKSIAGGANSLKAGIDEEWDKLLSTLQTKGGVDLSATGRGLNELAAALNGTDPNTDRAQAWEALLSALSADAEGLAAMTGQSADDIAAWLATLAEGANALDPQSAEGWDKLFTQLRDGLGGDDFTSSAVADLLALGNGSETARQKLAALGYSTDEIDAMQTEWLNTCQRLTAAIPGLTAVINDQTGEINGGVAAIEDYVDAWANGQKYMTLVQAQEARRRAVEAKYTEIPGLQVDVMVAENRVKAARAKLDALREKLLKDYGIDTTDLLDPMYWGDDEKDRAFEELRRSWNEAILEQYDLQAAADKANTELKKQSAAYDEAIAAIDEGDAAVEAFGQSVNALTGEIEANTSAVAEWTQEQKSAATDAVANTLAALQAVEKYYQNVADSTEKSINSTVSAFKAIDTPADQARAKMTDLTKSLDELNAAGKDTSGVQKQISAANDAIPTIQNMTLALEDQIAYLKQYQDDLATARAMGVSEDILALLSDGSVESADYLRALAREGNAQNIELLNSLYKDVQDKKAELAASLTDTRLGADDEFQALVDAAQAAAEGLNVYNQAEGAMESTVQGIADGIAAKIPEVQTQVAALNSVLSSLGNVGGVVGGLFGSGFRINGSHAGGLDYVPFDSYLAELHEGESVLTAEEARVWRNFKNGGVAVANTIDYSALGDTMRENIHAGGNVYLDGRVVGRVISEAQGNALRTLTRSGWQG